MDGSNSSIRSNNIWCINKYFLWYRSNSFHIPRRLTSPSDHFRPPRLILFDLLLIGDAGRITFIQIRLFHERARLLVLTFLFSRSLLHLLELFHFVAVLVRRYAQNRGQCFTDIIATSQY